MKETLVLLTVLFVVSTPGVAQTAVSADGVVESTSGGFRFPDGTTQVTAAAGVPDAWPQNCYHSGSLSAGETNQLTCFSYPSGDPGAWSVVPSGYYFMVTDVMIAPSSSGIGDLRIWVYHSYNCSDPSPGNRVIRFFQFSGDLETKIFSSSAPMLQLLPGDCIRVLNSSGSDRNVDVDISGYITTDSRFPGR